MYVRVTTFRAPPDVIEDAVATYREQAVPWMRDATGFRGWMVLIDREEGRSIGLTFWSDESAMRDEAMSGAVLRDEIARSAGTPMESLAYYEVLAAEALALDELGPRSADGRD
jgi:hypothetical protein